MKHGKKGRKVGRNTKWCQAYKLADIRGVNKVRKIARHLKRFPQDRKAWEALDDINALSVKKAKLILPERP